MPTSLPPLALITGASRGIGAAYARNLAEKGYRLLLVARDESRLTDLADTLRARHGIMVHFHTLDLSQPEASARLYDLTRQYCDAPDVLINNAGFGMYGAFHTHPLVEIQKMLQLHITTIVETIHAFIPTMIARQSGSIINVSSLAGFFSLPYMAEYAATKAFLKSFSEALAEEVRPFGITIQTCCPGQTETEFHTTAGFRPQGYASLQDPNKVVRVSLENLRSNHQTVTISWSGHVTTLLAKWLPRRFFGTESCHTNTSTRLNL